jgi:hypothetical protein
MKHCWRFSIARTKKYTIIKIHQTSIFDFQFVAKNIECQLKICTSYLVLTRFG